VFASSSPRGIRHYLKDFSVFHVNGEQRSSDREELLNAFRDAPKGLITNARCLTEGIDAPAVDMVAFIDPRQSKIDIVQATGRAMRKSDRTNKTVGYIVVPLFIDSESEDDIEKEFQGGKFEEIVAVLNALQEQDDDLADIIRTLREERGRGEVFNPRALGEKIEVLGEFVALELITNSIDIRIVDRLGSNWDEMYGRLVLFQTKTGHCRVPKGYVTDNGYRLAVWVHRQRGDKEAMNPVRRQRLEALPGWSWDPLSDQWEEGFSYLKQFSERQGHCRVPKSYVTDDGYWLGQWIGTQRKNKEAMNTVRRQRLESLPGWSW
jgi:Helicase associated domain/Helicase conserved C-terminal domain